MRWRDIVVFTLLLALGLSLYWPVFLIRPLDGDNLYVLAWVHSARIADLLRGDAAIYPEWRPLSYLTVWTEYRLFGLQHVFLFFLTNLVGWVGCAWLVYRIVCELTGRPLAAAVAGVIPLVDRRAHQALTWIIERQTIFACLFGLGAFLLIVRARLRPASTRDHATVMVLLLASMLSKEHGAAFAIALAFYGWSARRRDYQVVAAVSVGAYVALRVALAGGAVAPYCEDMGFAFGVQHRCLDPLSMTAVPQMLYNAAAATAASVVAGLFDPAGAIGPTPYRIATSCVLLVIAFYGWRSAPSVVFMPATLPLALGVTSLMLYRPRNVLIGVAGLAIVVGIGLAKLDRVLRLTRLHWVPIAGILMLLFALGRRAFDAHEYVQGTSVDLNLQEPCRSDLRERAFGASFVPVLKHFYDLPDPNCDAN
jgi:hypothetical protein